MPETRLSIESPEVRFTSDEFSALSKHLESMHDRTEIVPVDEWPQILMDHEARTLNGKLRYSDAALYQLVRLFADGTTKVTIDKVAGSRASRHLHTGEVSVPVAVDIFNAIARMRFAGCVEGIQLVCDTRTNTIEGVLANTCTMFSSFEMLTAVESILEDEAKITRFKSATVCGRRLYMEIASREPILSVPVEGDTTWVDRFFSGHYFYNVEANRPTSYASAAIFREMDNGAALSPVGRRGRVSHRRKDFRTRFSAYMSSISEKKFDAGYLSRMLLKLKSIPLGVCPTVEGYRERRHEILTSSMWRKGGPLLQQVPGQCLRRAIAMDGMDTRGEADDSLVGAFVGGAAASRTLFDLYAAITRAAATKTLTMRMSLGQVAWFLLSGRSSLTPKHE